jgi:hypothetical protein
LALIEYLKSRLKTPQDEPQTNSPGTDVKIADENPAVGE